MDIYGISSHKLNYHPERIAAWRQNKNIYPIYMEISPTGACNHRCVFCGLDFMKYQARSLDSDLLKKRLSELGRLGLKSAMYAGEGEPLIHKDIGEIAHHTKKAGIDVAFTTNGVLLNKDMGQELLPVTSWIKVSINAGTSKTYAMVHRTAQDDFDRVIENLAYCRELRDKHRYNCTLGMQLVLLPENRHEVVILAEIAKKIGMDYIVVKAYSQHPQSEVSEYQEGSLNGDGSLFEDLEAIATSEFSVICRVSEERFQSNVEKGYSKCLALPFWSYVDAGGGVWGCSVFLEDDRFYYGNINEKSFQEIWEGERRRNSLEWVAEKLDASKCRLNCRMDTINLYLHDIVNPPAHVNFI
ncbi:Cyclic pyranopterin phosphate synthase (MoaA) [hydrothermal vent metagenome]|uniref:Cyclic pyranopterin phosphate synthase (MoaA) n=1 Tax=hydrothermal vent metagenome TaxID=652676 RepID=A0A3B1BW63_9ZZZZ